MAPGIPRKLTVITQQDPHTRHRTLHYRYRYWHQNLSSAEPQQVLFATDCSGKYIN